MTSPRCLYLDHNATTPVNLEAREAMLEALTDGFGNPSSGHKHGRRAAALLEVARAQVAGAVDVPPDHVIFVSGATEAIHHAVHAAGPGRVLASAVEHPAVLAAITARRDRQLELVPVDRDGEVDALEILDRVDRLTREDRRPALVAVMAANNETGVHQPVAELVAPLRERRVPLLIDAVQLAGKERLGFELPDYLVLTAHKLGGPKGAGALAVRDPKSLPALIGGGGQEHGLRGGTEPIPAIAGFGAAMDLVRRTRDAEAARLSRLRDRLQTGLVGKLDGARVIGAGASARLPNTLCIALPEGAEGADVVTALDERGICISAGSACHAGQHTPSRVLTAMGVPAAEALRAVRISLGRETLEQDIDRMLEVLPEVVARLQADRR